MKTIILQTNSNSPFIHQMTVLEETEKAVKVENMYKTFSCWIPKKALVVVDSKINAFSFKTWFRKIDNGNAINKVFRLFN